MNTYMYANSLSEHKKWFAASPKVFFHPGVKLIEYFISFDFYDQFGFGIFDGFYVVWPMSSGQNSVCLCFCWPVRLWSVQSQ